ncbi:hypothetical protein PYW07_010663 [Mythimna separata]|uniref:Uncharacterized protein n=1 Tax=Mythimna separata TaxID=271217 RepID=A0AAD8DKL6_MYTSE|nr:hypothetical protein PYW07_010663 [Mythimna separata]
MEEKDVLRRPQIKRDKGRKMMMYNNVTKYYERAYTLRSIDRNHHQSDQSSHLRYGIIFWGNSTDKDIPFKAQKRCIRTMFKLGSTDSCKPYFINYNILTLPSLYIFEVVMFVKCNRHLFPRMADKVSRVRRDNTMLCSHVSKTALMRKSVFCMAPLIFNKLPKGWRELSAHILKKRLKLHLVGKAYYSILEFMNEKV